MARDFDLRALHAALDTRRTMFPEVMRVLAWLGAPAARFVRLEGR